MEINDLPPRAWTDLVMPALPPGADWFDFYTEWLADYLFATNIAVHPRQASYVEQMKKGKLEDCIFWISDAYGYATFALEMLQQDFANGTDWETNNAQQISVWQSMVEEGAQEVESFEDWAMTKTAWDRCHAEWLDFEDLSAKNGPPPDHADIAYRALLAVAAKSIPDRQKRIDAIRLYFRNFADNASK